jgi:glutamate formiminotransferase
MTLSCAVNLSEGRDLQVIDAISEAAARHCHVADISADPDHNRTVMTLFGVGPALVDGIVPAAALALQLIDLTRHRGEHPRLGAVDVVPFTPLRGSMDVAIDHAVSCARRLWEEVGVPTFLYEDAARFPEARSLPWIRKHAFSKLQPDFGGPLPHPTAGATVVGARGPLVAYNVNLDSGELRHARSIAAAIRSGEHSLTGVRALGLPMKSRGYTQVSVNITQPGVTTMWDVYRTVDELSREAGVDVIDSELIGLAPRASLGVADLSRLKLRNKPKTTEEAMEFFLAEI